MHVDGDRAGFGGVRVEQLRQQLAGRAGLRDEDQAGVAGRGEGGAAGAAVGGVDRVEGGPALAQQHRSGLGQRDGAAGAFQQRHPEPPFELPDRPRQRRLRDPEPLRGPPEVQLLGDGDEVPQLPRLHAATVPRGNRYPAGIAAHPDGVGRPAAARGQDRSMSEQTIALVTGANKGIGYEIAAGLGALGWSVGVGARDEQRREAAVEKLRAAGVDAFGVPLDVTDDASVAAAAELIEERAGRLDVLVNNAGVTGGVPQEPTTVDLADGADGRGDQRDRRHPGHQRDAAAAAPLGVAADREHVQHASAPSPGRPTSDAPRPGPLSAAYSPSKTFLNAVTVQYAKELRDTNILINAGLPRLRRDRPQRLPRRPHPRAGRGDRDPARDPARRRPDRRLLRGRRGGALVTAGQPPDCSCTFMPDSARWGAPPARRSAFSTTACQTS